MIKPFSQFRTENPLEAKGYKEYSAYIGIDGSTIYVFEEYSNDFEDIVITGSLNQVQIAGFGADKKAIPVAIFADPETQVGLTLGFSQQGDFVVGGSQNVTSPGDYVAGGFYISIKVYD